MIPRSKHFAGLLALALLLGGPAFAEPYLAVRYGLKCETCHVNPTGGGLRSDFGDVFLQTQLPAHPIRGNWGLWTGEVTKWLRLGGDLRYDANFTDTPHAANTHQLAVQQGRLYGEAQVIPNRLIFYADAQVTPGAATDHEAYAIYWSASHDWYVKAGKMYLPFGFRLEDQTAFVYAVSLTNMYSPDNGVELGWMRDHWDTQLTVSQGTFAGGLPSGGGREYGLQASYVESWWRLGVAANDDDATYGRRRILGVFGGMRTGPVEWLAEVDTVENKFATPASTQAAALLEADWLIAPGNNLKVTFEPYDPDRNVAGNGESRWSLVYELTPVQFVQIRAGLRDYNGPRGIAAENQSLWFIQLHGFF
ncbi:MAG TPA: hypothetical protein VGN43_10765 [Steroidobacteraceae bacterium]|jgi:hypothetical protein|nr:hypothetical protein [Steroidobacteraceae bacterium]